MIPSNDIEIFNTPFEISSEQIIEYFKAHESDIAHEVNDFGDLRVSFIQLLGREPEK